MCLNAPQEQAGLKDAKAPKWVLPFTPTFTPEDKLKASDKVGKHA